jgi:hypothetical protein
MVENIIINGKKIYRVAYSYLDKTKANENLFPDFIKVYTDILSTENNIFTFTYKAESSQFKEGLTVYDNVLKSLEWSQ